MFVYYFFSLMGSNKPTFEGSDYDDSPFRASLLGNTLHLICRFVQNEYLDQLWQVRQKTCTDTYLRDLSEFFHIMKSFIDYRVGQDMEDYGVHAAMPDPQQNRKGLVVSSQMENSQFVSTPLHLGTKLKEYRDRMETKWGQGSFSPDDGIWSSHSVPLFYEQPPPAQPRREKEICKTPGRVERERESVSFYNTTPPFVWNEATHPRSQLDPILQLRGSVAPGGYPKLLHPDKNKGKIVYPICMNLAFRGHCRCNDVSECQTSVTERGFGKKRLHIDLSDPQWSSKNYKPELWDSVVKFLKEQKQHVLPSDALKKLLPSTW